MPAGPTGTVGGVEDTRPGPVVPREALTTPRAAAIAGIVFAVLLGTSIVLLRLSLPPAPTSGPVEFTAGRRSAVAVAFNLVPYAGIAFLWFIGVVRDRIGEFEDRFFGTVFLGSGLVFLALLCSSTAVAGALVAGADAGPLGPDVWNVGKATTQSALHVYATKMAGVFMISIATIAFRTGVLPRWLAAVGLALAVTMVVLGGWIDWLDVAFPAWVLLVSVHILRAGLRGARAGAPPR